MEQIHAHCAHEGLDVGSIADPRTKLSLRKKILDRATREGVHLSKAALKGRGASYDAAEGLAPGGAWMLTRPGLAFAAGIVIALVCAESGGIIRYWRSSQPDGGNNSRPVAAANSIRHSVGSQPSDTTSSQSTPETTKRLAGLERALAAAQAVSNRLSRELAETESKGGQVEESTARRISELEQQLAAMKASEAQAQKELATLRETHAATEAALTAREHDVQELSGKLEEQSASIERETQLLSAGREIRDVVAARNLHIIDVYDTDGQGKTKKAFGRVFYTEGKSLLFYAYDLPAHRIENAKYGFYAWGKSDGNQPAVRSLGLLYNDDEAQKRWVLNITDPRVLAQIDSVFITLEGTDNPGNRPRGKEILSAYLHSPANHP